VTVSAPAVIFLLDEFHVLSLGSRLPIHCSTIGLLTHAGVSTPLYSHAGRPCKQSAQSRAIVPYDSASSAHAENKTTALCDWRPNLGALLLGMLGISEPCQRSSAQCISIGQSPACSRRDNSRQASNRDGPAQRQTHAATAFLLLSIPP